MPSAEAMCMGAQLDEDHAPETNGWMPVCRHCGAYTDSPVGRKHVPNEKRLARAQEWLETYSDLRRRNRAKVM